MIPGTPRIEELAQASAAQHVCGALGLAMATPRVELSYELLRAVAWASTVGRVPVSTRTLLDRAVDAGAALDGDVTDVSIRRKILRGRLDELAAVGDLAALGRGQWVSVTGSVVRVEDSEHAELLLVSGVPLRCLPKDVRSGIGLTGSTRVVHDVSIPGKLGLPVVRFDDWVRLPWQPLAEWTSDVISEPLDASTPDTGAASIRYYAPALARTGALQTERWITADPRLHGRYLARQTVLTGWTEFSVVELDHGTPIAGRGCDPHDVRRLMYGLDQQSQNPTTATCSVTGGAMRLQLHNPLPSAEARALLAFADESRNGVWTVRRHAATVRRVLTELRIDLQRWR